MMRPPADTPGIMLTLLLGMLPGMLLQVIFLGSGYLINFGVALLAGYATEILAQWLRNRSPGRAVSDGSVWITALLIALALPPQTPAGILVVAVAGGLAIGKHAYGGLGQNIFNPAMVGYAIVLVSFPAALSHWPFAVSQGAMSATADGAIDGLTGATILESFKHRSGLTVAEFWQSFQGLDYVAGRAWQWINVGYLVGGLFLLWRRIIPWQLPIIFLSTLAVLASLGYDSGSSDSVGSPAMHLFSGGTMLCAFFVLTDPVTCPSDSRGRILFAMLVAVMTFVIRAYGVFPDGLAFAILLGNTATPLLDRSLSTRARPGIRDSHESGES